MIYRMTSFDYRKVFGVTGNVPVMTNGFREFTGGEPIPGKPIGLEGGVPALSGLVGQPKRALCALEEKSKRKRKKEEVGREGRTPTHQTKSNSVWGGAFPLGLGRPPWGSLSPKARSPPSHLYIRRF